MRIADSEHKRILVTVKAYPNPSQSRHYSETVCCAGIDLADFSWIRLYPVPFRELDENKQFPKYSIIDVICGKSDDRRPESYRIREDSVSIIEHIDTKKDRWARRKSIVFRLPLKSHCAAIQEQKESGFSLALIKPTNLSFSIEKRSLSNPKKREHAYAQGDLFLKKIRPIEEIPYQFYFRFRCQNDADCPGHKLPIVDWEINQAYRQYYARYKNDEKTTLQKLTERWQTITDCTKKDVYFFVGNQLRFEENFMILGIFWPPLI